jgi:hypothetical protein
MSIGTPLSCPSHHVNRHTLALSLLSCQYAHPCPMHITTSIITLLPGPCYPVKKHTPSLSLSTNTPETCPCYPVNRHTPAITLSTHTPLPCQQTHLRPVPVTLSTDTSLPCPCYPVNRHIPALSLLPCQQTHPCPVPITTSVAIPLFCSCYLTFITQYHSEM